MTQASSIETRHRGIALMAGEIASRRCAAGRLKKPMATAIVGLMVLTGFAVLGQSVAKNETTPSAIEQPLQSGTLSGAREVAYTIDHMFELYTKSHDPSDLGRWNGTMGMNDWWSLRETYYYQLPARTTFPFVLIYNPYSTQTSPDADMGNSIATWYRLTADAKNVSEIASGPGMDPIFLPVLGPSYTDGAYVDVSWYCTYLENWELDRIYSGTHYANTYYGVTLPAPHSAMDDGFLNELQGKLTFNRAAANKFLNLSATGDLRDQFTSKDDAITTAWLNDWMEEGRGIYDIYTAYDFTLDVRCIELSLDPASTANSLVIRFWSMSWGNEILLTRYMEAANIYRYWQGWPDDWYLNISIGPDGGDVQSRAVIGYHMYATKDVTNNINGWALEANHIDWCGNYGGHNGYPTPYNWIDPDITDATLISWAPFTVNFGKPVSYAHPLMHWNLTAGEKIVVALPRSNSLPGYFPQASTTDMLDAAKLAELAGNVTFGEMVAGNGYPNSGTNNLKNFYNRTTKTYTLVGPLNFNKNWNPSFPGLLETGCPMFMMNVVLNITISLMTGWNLMSLPLVGYGYRASTLGLNVGDVVSYWDSGTSRYINHVCGVPVNDFNMIPGKGYWVNVPSGTRVVTIYGVIPNMIISVEVMTLNFTVPSGGGWVLVGLVGLHSRHAADIPGLCNRTSSVVAKWNPLTKSYTSWVAIVPSINNFELVPGDAFWIRVNKSDGIRIYP